MIDFGDWHDPFAEDEAATERERRRAEREARRRARQQSLADKVAAEQEPPRDTSATETPPPADPQPESGELVALSDTDPPLDAPASEPPPIAQPPPAPVAPPPLPPRPHDTTHRQLVIRRLAGLAVVIILAAIVAYGAVKVIGAIGDIGDDPPPSEPLTVEDIVIPEGLDRRQIADVAKEAGLRGDYAEATNKPPKGFDLGKYGAADAPNLEGFLFPAQYEVEKDTKVEDLVDKQLDAFKANLSEVNLSYAESKNLNVYDVLKIASMIEREIQVPKERELAAAVIYNRLKANTPLGIDATIRYEDQNYDEQLTESRLNEDTPYNTRTHPGLPPTPIGNPGLASIEAAANPAKSDVFYFVVKPGTCGEHVFVETEEEFRAAEAEYQAALEEQGGSPTEC